MSTKGEPKRYPINRRSAAHICCGEDRANARLTNAQAIEIVIAYSKERITQRELAEIYGVTEGNVGDVIRGRRYARVTAEARKANPPWVYQQEKEKAPMASHYEMFQGPPSHVQEQVQQRLDAINLRGGRLVGAVETQTLIIRTTVNVNGSLTQADRLTYASFTWED